MLGLRRMAACFAPIVALAVRGVCAGPDAGDAVFGSVAGAEPPEAGMVAPASEGEAVRRLTDAEKRLDEIELRLGRPVQRPTALNSLEKRVEALQNRLRDVERRLDQVERQIRRLDAMERRIGVLETKKAGGK